MENKAIMLDTGIWNVSPGMSAAYLIVGENSALLIDTGPGDTDIPAAVKEITDKPVALVISHHHGDHTGGAGSFESLYAHPDSIDNMRDINVKMNPVTEGFVFDLGGRRLEVIEIPGHTDGSIALLDRENKLIFTGDTISDGPVFMIDGECNLDSYINSLNRLLSMKGEIEKVFCCHGTSVQELSRAEKLRLAAADFKAGKLKHILQDEPMKMELYMNEEGPCFIRPVK